MTVTQRRTYALPITNRDGIARLVPRLRERYLTPQTDSAIVQAVGHRLYVWLWSENCNIRLELPLTTWRAERPYDRSVRRWGINLNRWLDDLETEQRDGRTVVPIEVETHELEVPR